MQLLIEEMALKELLVRKKEFIGRPIVIDSIVSSFSFFVSVILASYEDIFGISGLVFKTVFTIMGITFILKSIVDIVNGMKNNYTYENMIDDISELNTITHYHSIVIIKDTFNKFPNRFLVYDDKRWACKLFLNYKNNENNERFICEHLSNSLKIDLEKIGIKYVAQEIHEKFSVSANEKRTYCHKFYLATIQSFPKDIKCDSFEKDGCNYYWKSISDLEADIETMSKNSDVIELVKKYF